MEKNHNKRYARQNITNDEQTLSSKSNLISIVFAKSSVVFAFGFFISMVVLVFEILMRYALNNPTLWAHETTIFICGVGFIFGGFFGVVRNKHIRVVLIYDAVPAWVKKWLDAFIYFVCAISTLFFSYAAWLMVERAFFDPTGKIRLETTGSAWNPPTPALLKLFLLIILILMSIQFLIYCYLHLRGGRKDS